ncbi:hypothetical protein GGI18_003102 [Coemansia linderi]|uniref:Uncharacterized protein n=1 Tax=Coemansia linderi TaxID=2663919 RepID=A0ACC1KDF1_9FUNG|nr:hypothetical protein GGI18_003102 [Coemansia linderi]
MDFSSVQLEFMLPDQFAQMGDGRVAHNLEGIEWQEEKRKFGEAFAGKPHSLQSVIVTGYHPDLHSAAVTEFLGLFPDLESLAFTAVGREDQDNIDQLAGVLTALNPDLHVSIV